MFSEVVVNVDGLSKCYHIFDKPSDRLKQMFVMGRKSYCREFWALKDASFQIKRGETVGIIGRNGSGKSTLLQMICGTVSPTQGKVETHGRLAALLELGAGFNPEFTGRENVILNAAILGFPQSEIMERMEEVLAFSELGEFLDQPVKTYSSGMYSRLAFSIAIHVDPDILIVDEALAVGDARFVAKCMRRIKEIQARGATILFVSHDVGSVRTLCERAIWLDRGRIVDQGDAFPVTGRYMEYLFRDEERGDEVIREEVESQQKLSLGEQAGQIEPSSFPIECARMGEERSLGGALDSRPVTHWGSRKGIILSASVCDERGNRKDLHKWGDRVKVIIEVCIPDDVPQENLSVAFSIKDLKGTDLIVSTTQEVDGKGFSGDSHFTVLFEFDNFLATDKYLLVAAVERRQSFDVHYYEYVEGAHYFSSLSDKRFFGIFHPQIFQRVVVSNEK